jgi:hypothetical protein
MPSSNIPPSHTLTDEQKRAKHLNDNRQFHASYFDDDMTEIHYPTDMQILTNSLTAILNSTDAIYREFITDRLVRVVLFDGVTSVCGRRKKYPNSRILLKPFLAEVAAQYQQTLSLHETSWITNILHKCHEQKLFELGTHTLNH